MFVKNAIIYFFKTFFYLNNGKLTFQLTYSYTYLAYCQTRGLVLIKYASVNCQLI